MYILVTGGSGYIGSHCVMTLLKAGYEVIVIDDLSNSEAHTITKIREMTNSKSLLFHQFDLALDRDCLDLIFFVYNIDTVIHLAETPSILDNTAIFCNLIKIMEDYRVHKLILTTDTYIRPMMESYKSPIQTVYISCPTVAGADLILGKEPEKADLLDAVILNKIGVNCAVPNKDMEYVHIKDLTQMYQHIIENFTPCYIKLSGVTTNTQQICEQLEIYPTTHSLDSSDEYVIEKQATTPIETIIGDAYDYAIGLACDPEWALSNVY